MVANIARYHRKSLPKKKHENHKNLPTKYHRQLVAHLSAMLRVAVALDRRSIGAIAAVTHTFLDKHTLQLTLTPQNPADDCASELWNLEDKKIWFEELFEVTLQAQLA